MNYEDAGFLAAAYWGSNVVGLLFLLVASRWSGVARVMFAILFGYAAWINYNLSHSDPAAYLSYADSSVNAYTDFIRGWFSGHITMFVTVIAMGQLLIALGMLLKKMWVTLACLGAIVFLLAIAPLGYYAAFPFSVTVSIAAFLIIRNDAKASLWRPSAKSESLQKFKGPSKA